MVEFRVDRAGGLPAYLQLVRQVREAMRFGWLAPGDRLPTVRDVVASSGVNANTVLKAYRELELSGLVVVKQGSGTFVAEGQESIDTQAMAELRNSLSDWLRSARAAGLADDDVEALVRSVLGEQAALSTNGTGEKGSTA